MDIVCICLMFLKSQYFEESIRNRTTAFRTH